MASIVVVPANFGKHHLKSRTHNNLELLCAEGEVQRANSMILSLNSSVIEDLIARLEITSLDMQDFAAPAVNCFVESMYSGELENCDRTNFRDLNKMGHVFNVTWFVERCLRYFTDLVDKVTGRCYEDVLFVAEEAWFVEENLKKCELMDLIIGKLSKIGNKKSIFLKEYAADLNKISISQMSMVVKIAGQDVGILASVLANHLEKSNAPTLSSNSRYLFENIDFGKCFSNRRYCGITNTIVAKIVNESLNEEFKSAVKCISNFARPKERKNLTVSKFFQYPVMVDIAIRDFLTLDWDSLCDFLSHSDKICNLYQFFDAIFFWMFGSIKDKNMKVPRLILSDQNYLNDIIDIKYDRCWEKISKEYLISIYPDGLGTDSLINLFFNSDELSCDNGCLFKNKKGFVINALFSSENLAIPLLLIGEHKVPGCTEDSQCGILVKSSCKKINGSFNSFQLNIAQDVVNDEITDIHYHNLSVPTQTVSLLMEVKYHNIGRVTPIPFSTLPCLNSDGYWYWGFYYHPVDGEGYSEHPCRFVYTLKPDVLVNFMACLTTKNPLKE